MDRGSRCNSCKWFYKETSATGTCIKHNLHLQKSNAICDLYELPIVTETCRICGKKFERFSYLKKTVCSEECNRELRKIQKQEWLEKQKDKPKEEVPKKVIPKSKHDLSRDSIDAFELGMSYGQYMAKRYLEQELKHE